MWIPDEIKKCVAFLCIKNADDQIVPGGTGFFISVPSQKYPERNFTYFVTARHNLKDWDKKEFWIRVNSADGKILDLKIPKNTNWSYHPNHAEDPADVAVISCHVDPNIMDTKTVPVSWIIQQDEIEDGTFGVGNDVFITGLFRKMSGKEKNMPIVRVGNIAMLPTEKVPVKYFGLIDAYLIEARSIGGISGSPVFFCQPQQTDKGFTPGINFKLGGLVHGHWDDLEEKIDSFLPEQDAEESKGVNMGIAIITPASKILETLNQEGLLKARKESDEKSSS